MSHTARSAALAAVALAVASTLAHAQLGGLTKKAKQAVSGEANKAAASQIPPKEVDALPCNLSYEDLEAAEKGMQAELAAAPTAEKEAEQKQKNVENEQKAYEKAKSEYDKKSQAWGSCRDKVLNDPAAKQKLQELEAKAKASGDIQYNEEELKALALRAQAAAERTGQGRGTPDDEKTMQEFQRVMANLQNQVGAAATASQEVSAYERERRALFEKTCGAEPKSPTAPSSDNYSAEKVLQEKGAAAAGLPTSKYALVRECAIMSSTVRLKAKNVAADEAARINRKLEELQQLTGQLRAAKVPL